MVAYAADAYYAAKADALARGPQLYGGDLGVIALRCWKRYHKDSTTDLTDGFGKDRWITRKQARIHAVLLRCAVAGQKVTMQAVARETLTCPSTVSRAVTKFQAWGMFAIDVTRGRNGGMTVIAGVVESYVARAKAKLRCLASKAVNVAFTLGEDLVRATNPVSIPSTVMNATFSYAVLYERAMLALDDPDGEREAVHPITEPMPMTRDEHAAMQREDFIRRQEKLRRQAALDGDWALWERLGREMGR